MQRTNRNNKDFLRTLSFLGMCLLSVQQAERALQTVVEVVLDDPTTRLLEQGESQCRKTLGALVNRLKRQTRLDHDLKERLFRFIEMRNTFVHDIKSIDGWDLKTDAGRKVALEFALELMFLALAITTLMATVKRIFDRDELGLREDAKKIETEEAQRLGDMLEKHFGKEAKKILGGRVGQFKASSVSKSIANACLARSPPKRLR